MRKISSLLLVFILSNIFFSCDFTMANNAINVTHKDTIMFGNSLYRDRIFPDPTFPPITTQWEVQLAPAGKPGEPPILGQPVILSQEQKIYIK
ncbi:MAG: hypothetical protein ACOY3H_08220, partial [Bacillota bacterium]